MLEFCKLPKFVLSFICAHSALCILLVLLQHIDTGEILMQAFADRAALNETLQTRYANHTGFVHSRLFAGQCAVDAPKYRACLDRAPAPQIMQHVACKDAQEGRAGGSPQCCSLADQRLQQSLRPFGTVGRYCASGPLHRPHPIAPT